MFIKVVKSQLFCQKLIFHTSLYKLLNKNDYIHKQRSSKKSDLHLNQGPRKSRFPLNLMDIQTDRRTDICFYRVALLLKITIKTNIKKCQSLYSRDARLNNFPNYDDDFIENKEQILLSYVTVWNWCISVYKNYAKL